MGVVGCSHTPEESADTVDERQSDEEQQNSNKIKTSEEQEGAPAQPAGGEAEGLSVADQEAGPARLEHHDFCKEVDRWMSAKATRNNKH